MFRALLASIMAMTLVGCASLEIPSFYDDNESVLAVDLQWEVQQLDCKAPLVGATNIRNSLGKFILYSNGKESNDIGEMLRIMGDTVSPFYKRATDPEKKMSEKYCTLKKDIMAEQSSDITRAVMGRY